MVKTGFHAIEAVEFQKRINSTSRPPKRPTEDGKRAYQIRHRREEIQEDIALRRELEGFM